MLSASWGSAAAKEWSLLSLFPFPWLGLIEERETGGRRGRRGAVGRGGVGGNENARGNARGAGAADLRARPASGASLRVVFRFQRAGPAVWSTRHCVAVA